MKLYWLILNLKVVHIPIVLEGLSNGAHFEAERQENIANIKHSARITQEPRQVGAQAGDRREPPIKRSSFVDAEKFTQFCRHIFISFDHKCSLTCFELCYSIKNINLTAVSE